MAEATRTPTAGQSRDRERRALIQSVVAAAVLGVGAIVWGVISQSRVLLLDGAFMLVGIVLSVLSLMAARAAAEVPTRRFPFGKRAVTPLAIAVQGAALLGTLIYAAADAITIIVAGGSDVAVGTVVAYGLITLTCSLILSRSLARTAPDSDLVRAEVAQWRAGALLSLVYAAGAAVALLLLRWSLDDVVRYVDPGLVLLACLVLAPIPLRLLRAAGLELMEAAPPAHVELALHAAIEEVRAEFDLPEPFVRATKLGERLYVEIDFVVPEGAWDISGEDRVRRGIIERLTPLKYDLWANIELTTDRGLVE